MNRKVFLTCGSILAVTICVGVIMGGGVYTVLNIPSIKAGLQRTGNEFGALFELQQQVLQTYPCKNASVQLMNGDTLNVSLINSEFANLPIAQQSSTAQEIARFIEDKYTGEAEISQVVIIFVKNNRIGPINTSWSSSYPFDVSEIQ